MAVLRKAFEHLRIVLQVEVDGEIARTTATFAMGPDDRRNTVTLLDIDAARLLSDDERLSKIFDMGRIDDVETATTKLAGMPGVIFESRDSVVIRFW